MKRFRVMAVALLVWNLAGLSAFVMQWNARPGDVGDPITAEAFATMPGWAWVAYAAAVVPGTAGTVALLWRRKVAAPLFGLSLICVIAQFSWTVFAFQVVAKKGPGSLVFPLIIALVALAATLYARARAADHTLR